MPSEREADKPSDMLLIQLGVGQIGAAVVALVQRLARGWQQQFGWRIQYFGLADSSGFVVPDQNERQLPLEMLASIEEAHSSGRSLSMLPNGHHAGDWQEVLEQAIRASGRSDRIVVVDCAVGHGTTEMLLAARMAGAHIVLCNKDPLAGQYVQFRALQGDRLHGSLHLSATVGAGLPIASAVAAARVSGDPISELHAVASGSLGQLCSDMFEGNAFSDALENAIATGYCEPDPRVDLSGHDVARKLLILARLAGYPAELANIEVESLIPDGAASLSHEAFLAALPSWREHLRDRFASARASGRVLRYVGAMDARGHLSASLREVDQDSPLARGHGPENIFVMRTERYTQHPLVIAGPGAGVTLTAGAVIGDILRAVGAL